MARGGALRGAMTAWLGLIALHAVGTQGGAGRISELARDVATLIDRALDPNVPAIPDLRSGESWGSGGTWRPVGTYGDPTGRDMGRPGIDGVPLDAATRAKYGSGI